MSKYLKWFDEFRKSKEYQRFKDRPIAYFCAEFAIQSDAPTYAGGLGILAADTVKEAIDQELPLVAVGMFYEEGYSHHEIQEGGTILKYPLRKSPEDFGLQLVVDMNKQPVIVSIPLQGRQLKVRAFEKQIGSVRLLLLDTDILENDQADRSINNRLYVVNKENRFKQQMVLGIGGVRMLEALGIHPIIYHMNEGHSALLSFEVAYHEVNEHKGKFLDEIKRTKQHIIFTNHTLLAAGNDTFNNDMVSALLSDYSGQLQVPVSELISLGLIKDSSIFSMTLLAMRMSSSINAVSKLHAKKAVEIWADHPMSAVTNGIHIKTWDKIGRFEILSTKYETISNGKNSNDKKVLDFENSNSEFVSSFDIRGSDLWLKHQENKKELLKLINDKAGNNWDERHLLIGWARRMVPYKRPMALFEDKERLLELARDSYRPLRIVISGSAHESDLEGAKMLEEIRKLVGSELGKYVAYLPEYNTNTSKIMVSGCDVWLNTPVVGFEACGTSGMKACLNGVLPCTTRDGWFAEVELYGIGWGLDSDNINQSLLDTLKHKIVPMYYFRDHKGVPGAWIDNMKNSREMILNSFSTTRMLYEYMSQLHLPALAILQVLNK